MTGADGGSSAEGVQWLNDCRLQVVAAPWPFAKCNAAAVATHWRQSISRNPKMFDGDVFVVDQWSISDDVLAGRSLPVKFSAYLYWRDAGFDGGATNEAFATTLIVTADRGVFLARAVAGSINAGRYVSAGGFLDQRDVTADGWIDPAGAALREMAEETGLDGAVLERQPGFLLARIEPFLAITSVFHTALSGAQLLARVERYLAGQDEPELEAPMIAYRRSQIDALALTRFARLLSASVLE